MIYPTTALLSSGPGFRVGDAALFNAFRLKFQERMLFFGSAGADLLAVISGAQPSPRPAAPHKDDADALGQRLYHLAISTPAIGKRGDPDYAPPVLGPELTDQAFQVLSRLLKLWDKDEKKFKADRDALVQYLLVECSLASRDTLQTYPQWETAIFSYDHVAMFKLIQITHLHGNSRSRMRYLREFVQTVQGQLSLDAYIGNIRTQFQLVLSAFEDPASPGMIPADLLYRVVFLLGLDQSFFERPIQKLNEDKPDATTIEAMMAMQTWVRDYAGALPVTAANHVPRAMILGSTPPSSAADGTFGPRKSPLGVWDKKLHAAWCEWCWNHGYQNPHTKKVCRYFLCSSEAPVHDQVSRKASSSRRVTFPRDPQAMVAPVIAQPAASAPAPPMVLPASSALSRLEQGRVQYELMREYMEHRGFDREDDDDYFSPPRRSIMPPKSLVAPADLSPSFWAEQAQYLRDVCASASDDDGSGVGPSVGPDVGPGVGPSVGLGVGSDVDHDVGPGAGSSVDPDVGPGVGSDVGSDVGHDVGHDVGPGVGSSVSPDVSPGVGSDV